MPKRDESQWTEQDIENALVQKANHRWYVDNVVCPVKGCDAGLGQVCIHSHGKHPLRVSHQARYAPRR